MLIVVYSCFFCHRFYPPADEDQNGFGIKQKKEVPLLKALPFWSLKYCD